MREILRFFVRTGHSITADCRNHKGNGCTGAGIVEVGHGGIQANVAGQGQQTGRAAGVVLGVHQAHKEAAHAAAHLVADEKDAEIQRLKTQVQELSEKLASAEEALEDAKKKFVSFQKSLEFTVARIPAQTMQSFMKMKAVAFNDSDKNVVHVSHWQTWLQGSK